MLKFWQHAAQHFSPRHPACDDMSHIPIGFSGDDAKYTLAGSKVIVCMLSYVLQRVESCLKHVLQSFLDRFCVHHLTAHNLSSKHKPISSMNTFLTKSQGLDLSRFVFFVLRFELSLGSASLDPILRVAAWSLNVP